MGAPFSLALIVRDEALHLEDCLACFRGLAPEICVVDTGSTDRTIEIAQDLGAHVRNLPWNNDFAVARNACIEMCTCPWIFVVDADERLDAADIPGFCRLLDAPHTWAYRFVTRNYTTNPNVSGFQPCLEGDRNSHDFPGWSPSTKVRLFPNDPRIRFEGVVHELVNPSLERVGFSITTTDVPIHHYPFLRSSEAVARKQLLYIELGLEKVRRVPEDPKAHIELGNQYADLGDYAAAAAAYRAALHLQSANPETLKDLGGVLHLLGRHHEAKTALELAVRLEPGMHEGWRTLGVVHSACNAWERAARCFQHALRLDPTWLDGHRFLSVALAKVGRLEESAVEAQAALERLPGSLEAAAHYVDVMKTLHRTAHARDLLDTLLAVRPDARGWRHGYQQLDAHTTPGALG